MVYVRKNPILTEEEKLKRRAEINRRYYLKNQDFLQKLGNERNRVKKEESPQETKPRGRPRKTPPPTEPVEKKPRGRPRKIQEPTETVETAELTESDNSVE